MMEIQEWINKNQVLSDTLVEIQEMDIPPHSQAEIAFHRISDNCKVAKLPEDIIYTEEDSVSEITSVYENLGLLKFLEPNDDPRGRVLAAIFYTANNYRIDLIDVFIKKYGNNYPKNIGIGFINENSHVEIIFIGPEQNWFDLGCKLFLKLPN